MEVAFWLCMSAQNLDPVDSRRTELKTAFLASESVSRELSDAFVALRAQVAALRLELSATNAGNEHLTARLTALLSGLPGGVVVLDERRCVAEANPAALELLGEPLLGLPFAAVLTRVVVSGGHLSGQAELHSGRFVNISRRELKPDGEVVLLADVTESHLMQVYLMRQQRLLTLGELAAGLAHQIRTPLATALLYASQMSLPDRSAQDLRRCADRTVGSLRQLDRLVNDMLAFAHGGATRESVSVSALLEQVAQWLRPALRRGSRVTIRTEAPDLTVRANAATLVSAVLNLATNSLQATAADLNLELLARRSDSGRAQIIVSDNGPGIAPAIRSHMFEPFFSTRACGNGIGLSIVKAVIEAHDGTICLAQSSSGATFVIDLPAEEKACTT